jgi:hypothetical protein
LTFSPGPRPRRPSINRDGWSVVDPVLPHAARRHPSEGAIARARGPLRGDVASIAAGLFISRAAPFVGSLVQDGLLMLILPIPILGTVLLYLDIRRQTEGLDDAGLRAALAP